MLFELYENQRLSPKGDSYVREDQQRCFTTEDGTIPLSKGSFLVPNVNWHFETKDWSLVDRDGNSIRDEGDGDENENGWYYFDSYSSSSEKYILNFQLPSSSSSSTSSNAKNDNNDNNNENDKKITFPKFRHRRWQRKAVQDNSFATLAAPVLVSHYGNCATGQLVAAKIRRREEELFSQNQHQQQQLSSPTIKKSKNENNNKSDDAIDSMFATENISENNNNNNNSPDRHHQRHIEIERKSEEEAAKIAERITCFSSQPQKYFLPKFQQLISFEKRMVEEEQKKLEAAAVANNNNSSFSVSSFASKASALISKASSKLSAAVTSSTSSSENNTQSQNPKSLSSSSENDETSLSLCSRTFFAEIRILLKHHQTYDLLENFVLAASSENNNENETKKVQIPIKILRDSGIPQKLRQHLWIIMTDAHNEKYFSSLAAIPNKSESEDNNNSTSTSTTQQRSAFSFMNQEENQQQEQQQQQKKKLLFKSPKEYYQFLLEEKVLGSGSKISEDFNDPHHPVNLDVKRMFSRHFYFASGQNPGAKMLQRVLFCQQEHAKQRWKDAQQQEEKRKETVLKKGEGTDLMDLLFQSKEEVSAASATSKNDDVAVVNENDENDENVPNFYTQSLSYCATIFVLNCEHEEDAFFLLCQFAERCPLLSPTPDSVPEALEKSVEKFSELLCRRAPKILQDRIFSRKQEFSVDIFAFSSFQALFAAHCQTSTTSRLFDLLCYDLENCVDVFVEFAVAVTLKCFISDEFLSQADYAVVKASKNNNESDAKNAEILRNKREELLYLRSLEEFMKRENCTHGLDSAILSKFLNEKIRTVPADFVVA